jgi:hypothetical protein
MNGLSVPLISNKLHVVGITLEKHVKTVGARARALQALSPSLSTILDAATVNSGATER